MRSSIKLIALVSILGIAAYLLFIPDITDPQRVRARKVRPSVVPRELLRSPAQMPASAEPEPAGVRKPEASSTSTFQLIAGLPAALSKASPAQQVLADKLLAFITTGDMADIRNLQTNDILSLAELLTMELGPEAIAAAVESYFGLPTGAFLANSNAAQALTDLFAAVQSESNSLPTAPVIFSDRVEGDGTVTGNVHVIPAGTTRIYASFENKGPLQGLDRVLAVWRNPSDDRMVFTEYEPVRVGATYNYVWLELDQGWPAGFYQLDLFHPARNAQLLASRSFNVR
ncbi:MAG: hypothetical protein MUE94_11495 [Verrucomicrobia bacterium]|nr:hypothetical protein [Verrucomicrobiota bacterium]